MAPSLRTTLLTSTTLVSTTLSALSLATLYLTAHYTHGIEGAIRGGGLYIWYGSVGSPERTQYWKDLDARDVTQDRFHFDYDVENERWISVSAALGLLAGLAGLAMCGIRWWKNKKQQVGLSLLR
jgi:hypothetical protein